jgi:hypothetical protein
MVSIVNNGAIKTFVDSGTGINGIIINNGFILDSLINNGDIEINNTPSTNNYTATISYEDFIFD